LSPSLAITLSRSVAIGPLLFHVAKRHRRGRLGGAVFVPMNAIEPEPPRGVTHK
jgi:hypothetical protein